jgi:hypothetical protein
LDEGAAATARWNSTKEKKRGRERVVSFVRGCRLSAIGEEEEEEGEKNVKEKKKNNN